MKALLKVLGLCLAVLAVAAAAAVGFMYWGVYDVSTGNHDTGFVNWWFAQGTRRSVEHHAGAAVPPKPLDDPALLAEGARHYKAMCAQCHGAPGREPGEIAQGLWPKAPDLGKTADDWTPAQLFWIVKNGIKFTAMPAWGPSHSDDKLWALVAYVKSLPRSDQDENGRGGPSPRAPGPKAGGRP